MRYSRFEEVPVWQAAVELARGVYGLTEAPVLRPSLRYQLERAALSISNNIAEGFERGTTQELLNFLYIARGSAGEVRSILCVAEKLVDAPQLGSRVAQLKVQVEGIARQLYGWITQLKTSSIKGQRRLIAPPKGRPGAGGVQEDAVPYAVGAEPCEDGGWEFADP